jgi:predicted O-linked N-acetylglucosamine transferase (SPINDLY family)
MAVIVPGCPDDDNRAIAATRTAFASTLASRPPRRRDRRTNPSPIRVGYVSSFFHRPNWMKPVWALLNHHDRGRVCVHLFSDCPPTQIQGGYRPHDRDLCHDISNCSNQEACRLIEKQQLDLLVDLNSYSALKRIGLYALRPAPIIVGWFNLYATSGLAAFDYLIGDETVIPPTEEVFYSERILRVPHTYLAFDVDYPVPDIAPVPMKATGTLTIGSLASLYKLTDQVLATWSEIMARCPNATLLIRNAGLKHPEQRALLSTRFATAGVETNRLILEGPADHHEYLRTYDRIDFALDPFPYGGGTTTMEALWQGVPVVTLNGDRWASRTSASLLHAAGLDEYVARDRGDYVELAARLATSVETADRLGVFRATIRDRLRQSPACDGAAMARAMEALYSEIVKRKG